MVSTPRCRLSRKATSSPSTAEPCVGHWIGPMTRRRFISSANLRQPSDCCSDKSSWITNPMKSPPFWLRCNDLLCRVAWSSSTPKWLKKKRGPIVPGKADNLLALKENQHDLHDGVKPCFNYLDTHPETELANFQHRCNDGGHGCIKQYCAEPVAPEADLQTGGKESVPKCLLG